MSFIIGAIWAQFSKSISWKLFELNCHNDLHQSIISSEAVWHTIFFLLLHDFVNNIGIPNSICSSSLKQCSKKKKKKSKPWKNSKNTAAPTNFGNSENNEITQRVLISLTRDKGTWVVYGKKLSFFISRSILMKLGSYMMQIWFCPLNKLLKQTTTSYCDVYGTVGFLYYIIFL